MTQEELTAMILDACKKHEGVASASKIDGDYAIGVEVDNGDEYFITIDPS